MITEAILSLLFGVVNFLLGFIPDLTWNVDNSIFTTFFDIIRGCCYFLPMGTVTTIFWLIVTIIMFRIGVSLVKTVVKFIPLI